MPGLVLGVYSLGKHVWFVRDGDAFTQPAPGVTSRLALPDAADAAWIDLGVIESWEDDYSGGQDLEVWRPSPGHLELYESREIKAKLTHKFTTGEVGPLAHEVFYRAAQKLTEASAQFNPGSGTLRSGWLHQQLYDAQTDALVSSYDVYGRIKITGGMDSKDGSIVKPNWEFLKLYSPYNTAGLGA